MKPDCFGFYPDCGYLTAECGEWKAKCLKSLPKWEPKELNTEVYAQQCPHCGVAGLKQSMGRSSTLMAPMEVYNAEGKRISENPNVYTYGFKCLSCGKYYHVKEQFGKIIEVK